VVVIIKNYTLSFFQAELALPITNFCLEEV
jgi:hypothetical protein